MMLTHLNKKLVLMDPPRCTHPFEMRQPTAAFILDRRKPEQIGCFYCPACDTYVAYDGILVEQAPVIFGERHK